MECYKFLDEQLVNLLIMKNTTDTQTQFIIKPASTNQPPISALLDVTSNYIALSEKQTCPKPPRYTQKQFLL